MWPARRMESVPASGTLKVLDLARRLELEGKDIIHLDVGQPDFDTPEHIKESAEKALAEGITGYTSSTGTLELRTAISEDLRNKDIDRQPEEIIVTPGAKHAIFSAIAVTLDPGDEIIIPSPCWTYEGMARIVGAEPIFVECSEKDGFRAKSDELESKITSKTKALLINYPNNPTGAVLDEDELRKLADLAADNQLWILTDEVYDALTYGERSKSIASFSEVRDRAIYINSFSKTYAMAGWRLGYAAAPDQIISGMVKIQQNSTTCAASFTQAAGIAALKGPQDCVRKMAKEYERRREVVIEGLNSIKGIRCIKPEGAFYAFPNVEGLGMNSVKLCKHLLKEVGVAAIPGSAFGPGGEGHLRISFANSMKNLKEAIERIKKFV